MEKMIMIHPQDTVAVALTTLEQGTSIQLAGRQITTLERIPSGHKFAIVPIPAGEKVIKYGVPIGHALQDIPQGAWVHTHNLKTDLSDKLTYSYTPVPISHRQEEPDLFEGYLRANGSVGVRNEIWILPTVGCVNSIAQNIARQAQDLVGGSLEGVYAFPHPYGCSQLGCDHRMTQDALVGLVNHPNAGGVLVLGLGCENNNLSQFRNVLGSWDPERVKFLNCQDCADEATQARILLEELAEYVKGFQRQECPASKLVIGLKCGGSDGFSGLTANPLVGAFSNKLVAQGGTTILTEVPEMFGAETILMNRCVNREVFDQTVGLINDFKDYYLRYGQNIYENPSPGNKAGGISTLEDKSLGCIQKGGDREVVSVLQYGQPVQKTGLNLLQGPGNDLVASTALSISGAQIVLFTTGRGTPFGCPVPTVKISSNTDLYTHKPQWIDFDSGVLVTGTPMDVLAEKFFRYVLSVASGKQTANEVHNLRDIAIFKDGVTL